MRTILRGLLSLGFCCLLAACNAPAAVPAVSRVSQAAPAVVAADIAAVSTVQPAPTAVQPTAIPTLEPSPTAGQSTPEATAAATARPTTIPTPEPTATAVLRPTPGAQAAALKPLRHDDHPPLAPSAMHGVGVAADILYVRRAGAEPCQTSLDVYVPPGARALPVLIYVHGGGWTSGDKNAIGAKAAYFASRRFAFVSINYRLMPAAWPAEQAADVAEAVAWVRGHIEEYGGDGTKLFVLGHSAGAHLTALVASDRHYLQRAGLDLSALRGVVLLDSAAYDVEMLMRTAEGQSEVYRPPFGSDPAGWRRVSPRAHVARGNGIPPHLLLLATAGGPRRPVAESLAAALREAGVYAHLADATAFRDHITINEELGRPGDTPTAAVQAFLDMLLAGAPAGLGGSAVLRPPGS